MKRKRIIQDVTQVMGRGIDCLREKEKAGLPLA